LGDLGVKKKRGFRGKEKKRGFRSWRKGEEDRHVL